MKTPMRQWVDQYSDENVMGDESNGLIIMDGYDDCIVGVATRFGAGGYEQFVVYDRQRVIQKLMSEGMTEEEAWEFHDFNQSGAYTGEHTPAFLTVPESQSVVDADESDVLTGEL